MKIYLLLILFTVILNFHLSSQVFWDEPSTGVSVSLNSVSNVNGQIAWACGNNRTLIKTINNGYLWTSAAIGIPANATLVNIYALDGSIAFTAGYIGTNTFVYRTTNGGTNWVQVFTQTNGFINAIWMFSSSTGFMEGDPVGGRWSLWKTSTSGTFWDSTGSYLPQAGTEAGWNNSLWFFSSKIWFGTNNTKIYFSSNLGANWISYPTTGLSDIYTITFDTNASISTGGGYAAGTSLLKSTNSGQNWSAVTIPGTGDMLGAVKTLLFPSGSWVTRGNSIYFSNNFGSSWQTNFTASNGLYTHLAKSRANFFNGPGFMYATKSNGGISRASVFIEGVTIISGEIPKDFKLNQNYPNPFNPSTKLTFSVTKLNSINASDVRGAFVSLRVYNTLGKEIAV